MNIEMDEYCTKMDQLLQKKLESTIQLQQALQNFRKILLQEEEAAKKFDKKKFVYY